MRLSINWRYTILYSFLLNCIVAIVFYFLFEDAAAVLIPIVVAPFPVLLNRLHCKDAKDIKIDFGGMLAILGFAAGIIAIDVLLYLLYYVAFRGRAVLHLMVWKDLICFVCATSLLHLTVSIPALLFPAHTSKTIVAVYMCITAIVTIIALLVFVLIEATKVSFEAFLIVSIIAFAISATLCLYKRKRVPYSKN